MLNLILLPLCLVAGFLLKRFRVLPDQTSTVLNTVVIWVSYPALVLVQVPPLLARFSFSRELLAPLLAAWIAFALSAVLIYAASKKFKWSRSTTGALMLTAGLGNTSFVGFPIVEAFYGSRGLQYALIVDQTGTFLVLSTLGILIASSYSGARVRPTGLIKGIIKFPPFIAVLTGVALSGSGILTLLTPSLERLGATLVPLALLSVGTQLHVETDVLRRRARDLSAGLAVKLVIVPLLFAVGLTAFSCDGLACKISLLEVAMGPMITAAIVATSFRLDSEIAGLMVGVGTPLSILTVWLWHVLW